MKKRYWVLIILILLIILGGFKVKRYFECDFSIEAGGPAAPRPEYCDAKERKAQQFQDKQMLDQFNKNIIFQCSVEKKPELPPETQTLYNYAYYHDLHNLWEEKDGVWDGLAHYYRIAAAHGDYKANVRLQYLLEEGKITSADPRQEVFDLNKQLSAQLPATAYYKTYGAINDGTLTTEEYGQFAFLRKAAELGSAEAQFELSNVIMQIKDEPTHAARLSFSEQLEKCASENGYGEASNARGIFLQATKKYPEALETFQKGIRQGDSSSASWLKNAFELKLKTQESNSFESMYNLDLDLDLDRVKRYTTILDYLFTYDYLNPKVPDLDQIVPLPPAKLPTWDGKIAFQRWYEGPSPEKPSEELVEKLAKAKSLDPKTGLPLKK